MYCNAPLRFLSWFPATHTFMLARLSPVPRGKGTNKAACFGLEAIRAIWMSNKLPGMSYEEGHCYNDAYCGCRFLGKGATIESLTYVSFEKVDEDFLPIMVYSDLRHFKRTYSENSTSFTSSMIVNTPFIPHPRVKKIFLKAFSSYKDEWEIKLLFQQAVERGGGGHFSQASKGGGFEVRISWCLRLQKWKISRARRSSGRRLFLSS